MEKRLKQNDLGGNGRIRSCFCPQFFCLVPKKKEAFMIRVETNNGRDEKI
jgi:hypothetical protein